MFSDDVWIAYQEEVDHLLTLPDYQPFLKLLELARSMIGARLNEGPGLLEAIKELHSIKAQGGDVQERLKDLKTGTWLDKVDVYGNLNQANRDNIQNYVYQIIVDRRELLEKAAPAKIAIVPIALLVMTDVEAQQLANETAFERYPPALKADFRKLRRELEREHITDWLWRYHSNPADWQPFGTGPNARSIQQLVTERLQSLTRDEHYDPPLTPLFKDMRQLYKDRPMLQKLRENGCLVVMDAISLRHPAIQRAYQLSLLDGYPKTAVVHIAPSDRLFDAMHELNMVLKLQLKELDFVQRREEAIGNFQETDTCEETSKLYDFQVWIKKRVDSMKYPRASREESVFPYIEYQSKPKG